MASTELSGGAQPGGPVLDRFPREVWVLVGAGFLIAIGYGLVAPAIPEFATGFGVGITAASVVISAFAAMRLVFAPASGRLVTRFGERPIYLWGILIVGLGSLACAVAAEYWQLLLFRSLSGVGSTMFSVSSAGLLIRISPPRLRGRVSSLMTTSFLLGGIAGPAFGGGLVAFSLRAPFLVYGVVLLLVVLLVWLSLRGSALAGRATREQEPAMTFRAALRHGGYRAALASNFANGWVVLGVRTSLVPLFVTVVLLRQPAFTGVALVVFAVASAVAMLVSGRLTDRYGRRPLALGGLGLLAVGVASFGVPGAVWPFLASSLVAGIGAGMVSPAQTAAVADVLGAKARGGTVLAGFQMAADIGTVIGPLAAGALAEHWSYAGAFAVCGVLVVLAGVVWLLAPETLPTRPRPSSSSAGDR